MSISTLRAAVKTAHDHTGFTRAKRGQFALVERRHTYLSLKDGHREYFDFLPGLVTSVTRDGEAKEVQVRGLAPLRRDRRDWHYLYIDGKGTICDPRALCATLVNEFGAALAYGTREEAVAAIREAAGVI